MRRRIVRRHAYAPTSSSRIDLVVTRHPALVELLRERGLVQGDVPIMSHATAEDVRGKHVAGILPLSLASQAASVTEIDLNLTPQDRASGELSLDRLREIAGPTVTYHCVRQSMENPLSENPRTSEQWAFMLGGVAVALGGVAYVVTDPNWPLGPNFLHGLFGTETPQQQAQDAAASAAYQQRQMIGQAIALFGLGFVATMAWRTRS